MLRFAAADLSPVIQQARSNICQLALVKDEGVFFMATHTPKVFAYAIGCNPAVDKFDDWWELSRRELGGSDFVHYFDPHHPVFSQLLEKNVDLILDATPDQLILSLDTPSSDS